ncbi:group III truncated hemoglobin [Pedobacter changchengzhani]|uniref:Group III truncated hemoglobin n=1 Tax=Pedobacter changchengzhani TaxID=2529274 RepID=A0A4R5MJB5_9SPHI|nr:group III truncated hemoglobin [Pedobacter changchengzhani]TDG35622.1 group III truncated hemoglobin [Pedobacter changchengzhani]
MRDIATREDIRILVHTFYAKIRKDELLGVIFNTHIHEDAWPPHLKKLTDFWETNLFGVPKYKGNLTQKHINVDKSLDYTIDQVHFGQWLNIWFETINELYDGDYAQRAKDAARKMSTGQFLAI